MKFMILSSRAMITTVSVILSVIVFRVVDSEIYSLQGLSLALLLGLCTVGIIQQTLIGMIIPLVLLLIRQLLVVQERKWLTYFALIFVISGVAFYHCVKGPTKRFVVSRKLRCILEEHKSIDTADEEVEELLNAYKDREDELLEKARARYIYHSRSRSISPIPSDPKPGEYRTQSSFENHRHAEKHLHAD